QGSHQHRNVSRGPAERGCWAPRAQPLMGVAVLTVGLARFAPPAHATATRPLRPSPDATAGAACMCCTNDPPPTAVEGNKHSANSGLAGAAISAHQASGAVAVGARR